MEWLYENQSDESIVSDPTSVEKANRFFDNFFNKNLPSLNNEASLKILIDQFNTLEFDTAGDYIEFLHQLQVRAQSDLSLSDQLSLQIKQLSAMPRNSVAPGEVLSSLFYYQKLYYTIVQVMALPSDRFILSLRMQDALSFLYRNQILELLVSDVNFTRYDDFPEDDYDPKVLTELMMIELHTWTQVQHDKITTLISLQTKTLALIPDESGFFEVSLEELYLQMNDYDERILFDCVQKINNNKGSARDVKTFFREDRWLWIDLIGVITIKYKYDMEWYQIHKLLRLWYPIEVLSTERRMNKFMLEDILHHEISYDASNFYGTLAQLDNFCSDLWLDQQEFYAYNRLFTLDVDYFLWLSADQKNIVKTLLITNIDIDQVFLVRDHVSSVKEFFYRKLSRLQFFKLTPEERSLLGLFDPRILVWVFKASSVYEFFEMLDYLHENDFTTYDSVTSEQFILINSVRNPSAIESVWLLSSYDFEKTFDEKTIQSIIDTYSLPALALVMKELNQSSYYWLLGCKSLVDFFLEKQTQILQSIKTTNPLPPELVYFAEYIVQLGLLYGEFGDNPLWDSWKEIEAAWYGCFLNSHGIPFRIDRYGDAWSDACNHTMQVFAHCKESAWRDIQTGFIHAPMIQEEISLESLYDGVFFSILDAIFEDMRVSVIDKKTLLINCFPAYSFLSSNETAEYFLGEWRDNKNWFSIKTTNVSDQLFARYGVEYSNYTVNNWKIDWENVWYTLTNGGKTLNVALGKLPVDMDNAPWITWVNNLPGDGIKTLIDQWTTLLKPDIYLWRWLHQQKNFMFEIRYNKSSWVKRRGVDESFVPVLNRLKNK